MIKYIFLILIMFSSSNNYETQQYDIISSDDDFEIRFYHSAIKAKVISDKNANGNFYKLFQFISGNNSKKKNCNDYSGIYENDNNLNTMEFVMPSSFNMEHLKPNDKDIVIYKSEAKYYACIRYGGYSNSSN